MMIGKKGLSPAVAIFLIILVSVAAVAVIWSYIIPVIKEGSLTLSSEDVDLTIVSDAGYTYYDSMDEIMSVQVRRGDDIRDELYFKLIVGLDDGNSVTSGNIFVAPDKDSTRTYEVGMRDHGIPVSVNLVPVFKSGREFSLSSFSSGYDIPLDEGDSSTSYYDTYSFNGTNVTIVNIIPISGCGVLDVEDAVYVLNRSLLEIVGNCFIIDNDGITLNLGGFRITGDDGGE